MVWPGREVAVGDAVALALAAAVAGGRSGRELLPSPRMPRPASYVVTGGSYNSKPAAVDNPYTSTMRAVLSFLLFAFLGAVQALSSTGSRLLVVLEEAADKDKYSKFWGDLSCKLVPPTLPKTTLSLSHIPSPLG